jgi:magnesium transporter
MMLHRDVPIFDRETIVYIQDIYDHIVRVTDSIDVYRDLLSNVLDAYLSMTSNRMNQTVRVLTASSIILMSMALIAGIYGMNFRLLPELEWTHGYLFAICLMIAVATTLALFFRRRGWL